MGGKGPTRNGVWGPIPHRSQGGRRSKGNPLVSSELSSMTALREKSRNRKRRVSNDSCCRVTELPPFKGGLGGYGPVACMSPPSGREGGRKGEGRVALRTMPPPSSGGHGRRSRRSLSLGGLIPPVIACVSDPRRRWSTAPSRLCSAEETSHVSVKSVKSPNQLKPRSLTPTVGISRAC